MTDENQIKQPRPNDYQKIHERKCFLQTGKFKRNPVKKIWVEPMAPGLADGRYVP
jgi:hypothetical protein